MLVVVGVTLGGVTLLVAVVVLLWFLLKKKDERSVDVNDEFKGISSRPSFRNAIQQSFVNQTHNTTAVIYTLDEYYANGKVYNIVNKQGSFPYSNDKVVSVWGPIEIL